MTKSLASTPTPKKTAAVVAGVVLTSGNGCNEVAVVSGCPKYFFPEQERNRHTQALKVTMIEIKYICE